ncbi:MAG: 4Fe-4S dicluster domain-containing protein [Thermoguttaceae bacterium]|nr:4Fe-4S dicluster domain-containing protein [Thermoguttaceae bacterium]MDW8039521.1 4Fe-4S dicluster domain-containing protein [Thermoguttaceae bacterium]
MSKITLEDIRQAGVVGAGGAGFPTHVKLSAKVDTVVLNAAECEPLLHKDKELLRHETEVVVAGLAAAMELVGAQRAIIGIKEKYQEVMERLRSRLSGRMELAPLRDCYPAGDEMILVYDVLGRVVPPGGLPLHVGAVVINVETAFNIARSDREPVTEKYLTVGGAVRQPVTVRVPVGVTVGQCVEAAGGATVPNPWYFLGGVMMGRLENDPHCLVDKTLGGIIVLDQDHPMVRRRRQDWAQITRIGRSACDQCSFCTELCPRWLLGHPIEPHRAMRSLGFNLVGQANVQGTVFCCECNLCSLYSCPEDLDPKNVCAENKRRLLKEGQRWPNPPFVPERAGLHLANRKAPMARLMHKLGLGEFPNDGPLQRELLTTRRVGILLKQHVGAPCVPVVAPGQRVRKGQLVGRLPEQNGKPALGAPVHASIDGRITAVAETVVWIEAE